MEKPYLNQKELTELLGQGRRYGERVMQHLLKIAVENNYYIPESKREILIPVNVNLFCRFLVKSFVGFW